MFSSFPGAPLPSFPLVTRRRGSPVPARGPRQTSFPARRQNTGSGAAAKRGRRHGMRSLSKFAGRCLRRFWASPLLFIVLLLLWMAALVAEQNFYGMVHALLLLAMVQLASRIAHRWNQ